MARQAAQVPRCAVTAVAWLWSSRPRAASRSSGRSSAQVVRSSLMMISQQLAQHGAGAVEAGLDGSRGALQQRRRLGLAETLQVEQHDQTRVGGESHERRLDLVPHDLLELSLLHLVLNRITLALGRVAIGGIKTSLGASRPLPTVVVDEQVVQDAK